MNPFVRDRILTPLGIPIAVLIGVGFFIVNLSRILLAVNKQASVAIATGVAILILGVSAWVATRPRIARSTLIGLLVVLALMVGTGGAIAARHGERTISKHAAGEQAGAPSPTAPAPGGPQAGGEAVAVTAKDFAWQPTTMTLKGGAQITVRVRNEDSAIHNWSLYSDPARTQPVFQGETFSGPGATKEYTFAPPPPGTYYFRCDVHPDMQGTATVS